MNTGERWLFNLAALVVVLAGIKSASAIIVTLLVALFVALVSAPLSIALQRRGVPNVLSVLIVLVLLLSVIAGLSAVVGGSVNAFSAAAPVYEARLNEQLESLWLLAASYDIPIDADPVAAILRQLRCLYTVIQSADGTWRAANQWLFDLTDCGFHFDGSRLDATESPRGLRT